MPHSPTQQLHPSLAVIPRKVSHEPNAPSVQVTCFFTQLSYIHSSTVGALSFVATPTNQHSTKLLYLDFRKKTLFNKFHFKAEFKMFKIILLKFRQTKTHILLFAKWHQQFAPMFPYFFRRKAILKKLSA